MDSRDILLTGIPRSGTTLVCSLLNRLPNTVALVEPMAVSQFPKMQSSDERRAAIRRFLSAQRASLLSSGSATARVTSGIFDDNTFSNTAGPTNLRNNTLERRNIDFDKPLDKDFLLLIKHPNAFTAILNELTSSFSCFAIVRHPASVIASWDTLDLPLRDGHAPAAEALDTTLRRSLEMIEDRRQRQIHLMDWYFSQYLTLLPGGRILRYEDIVQSSGKALSAIAPPAAELGEALENRNRNTLYDRETFYEVRTCLASHDGHWKTLYPEI